MGIVSSLVKILLLRSLLVLKFLLVSGSDLMNTFLLVSRVLEKSKY